APLAHLDCVVAGAAGDEVVSPASEDEVVPGATVQDQPDPIRGQVGGVHLVVSAEGVQRQLVGRHLRAGDVHNGKRAHEGADARSVAQGHDLAEVVSVGAVDDDGVGLAVAAARGAIEVQVDVNQVGCGQVVDGDGVEAVEGVEVHRLDAVEVQGDAAHV